MPTGHSAASAISIPTTTPRPTGRRRDERAAHAAYLVRSRVTVRPPAPSLREKKRLPHARDREFESLLLRRRVCLTSELRGYSRRGPVFAAVWAGIVTREGTGWPPPGSPRPFFSVGH